MSFDLHSKEERVFVEIQEALLRGKKDEVERLVDLGIDVSAEKFVAAASAVEEVGRLLLFP